MQKKIWSEAAKDTAKARTAAEVCPLIYGAKRQSMPIDMEQRNARRTAEKSTQKPAEYAAGTYIRADKIKPAERQKAADIWSNALP